MPPIPKSTPTTPPASAVLTKGNTALITGGASGIGLAIAQICRQAGMKVGIVDRNTELLDQAKESLANGAPEEVFIFEMDVSKFEDWKALVRDAGKSLGNVNFLVLNAGVSGKGSWGDGEYFETVLQTNLYGVINGLNAFVPVIQAQKGQSAIVITGSKQGITNPPGNPAYNASKSAVKTIAEHLSYDLKDTKTSVHLLLPGWTFTGMSGGHPGSTKEKPAGAWAPEQVAEFLVKKMEENKFYILCPDNSITNEMDWKRLMWNGRDMVEGRPALSRWRMEYEEEFRKWMEEGSL